MITFAGILCWWQIQGAIIVASLFEIVLGMSGLIGLLLRYIGPLAIAPTITLVGLALFNAAASSAAKNWYIAIAYVLFFFSSLQCQRQLLAFYSQSIISNPSSVSFIILSYFII